MPQWPLGIVCGSTQFFSVQNMSCSLLYNNTLDNDSNFEFSKCSKSLLKYKNSAKVIKLNVIYLETKNA